MVVVSVDAAWSYNRLLAKGSSTMAGRSLSGWKPNLMFPHIREHFAEPSQRGFVLFLTIAAILAIWTLLAYRSAARPRAATVAAGRWRLSGAVAAVSLVILCSSVATASQGDWFNTEYLMDGSVAQARAMRALVALDQCRLCFSSSGGQVDWTWLAPNPAQAPQLDIATNQRTVTIGVTLDSQESNPGFGRVQVDFGDGSRFVRHGIVNGTTIVHTYEHPGRYRVIAALLLPGLHTDTRTITVD